MAWWFLLAIVVFNVRFDWQTRAANHRFVGTQIERHRQGLPTLTINGAFRPMVRDAAVDGAQWFLAVAAVGAILTLGAAKLDA
jgi:hypothetical protein